MAQEDEALARSEKLLGRVEGLSPPQGTKTEGSPDAECGAIRGILEQPLRGALEEEYFMVCQNCGTLVSSAFLMAHYAVVHPDFRDAWAKKSAWSNSLYSVSVVPKKSITVEYR